MTVKTQDKWDQRYHNCTDPGDPCWVLDNYRHLLPSHGSALDLACGLGANALLMAQSGLQTHAWDISQTALQKLSMFARQRQLSINTVQRDVERHPPEQHSFDVIVVSQFLYRPIMSALVAALKPHGLLFYQTFHEKKTCQQGPSRSEFLLKRNELLKLLSPLELVFYREDCDIGHLQQGLRNKSYFIGQCSDKQQHSKK